MKRRRRRHDFDVVRTKAADPVPPLRLRTERLGTILFALLGGSFERLRDAFERVGIGRLRSLD